MGRTPVDSAKRSVSSESVGIPDDHRAAAGRGAAGGGGAAVGQAPDVCCGPGREPPAVSDRPPAVRSRSWLLRTVESSRDFA
jgi:hypothetical protein